MEFVKFNSVENSYREKEVERIYLDGYGNYPWIATEKIHGANFSFWYQSGEFRVASRTQFVDPSNFYKCTDVVDRYREAFVSMCEYHDAGPDKDSVIAVYGELYGPGIQKGINYGPKKDFVAFDLVIDGFHYSDQGMRNLLEGVFPVVPVVKEFDNLSDALLCENEFDSILGKMNGVEGENVAEGVILLPQVFYIRSAKTARPILKLKNDKWKEKASQPKVPREKRSSALAPLIAQYVTENRMNAVLSKMGPVTTKDFGDIIRNMSQDVIEDMVKDEDVPDCWRELDEYKTLGKDVNAEVVPFLKKALLPTL